MSIEYIYVNHSKKQYFDVGLFGESCRLDHAGYSFGSRVLSLLISEEGSWNSDSIEMLNDLTDKSIMVSKEYLNINIEAEILLLDIDGLKYFSEESELDFVTFSKLYLYAIILQKKEVTDFMNKKYGHVVWQKKYKNHYNGHTSGTELAIYEYQNRDINLYKK